MGLSAAQLEVISSSEEFVLPQTEMFNPRKRKKKKKERNPCSLPSSDSFLLLPVDGPFAGTVGWSQILYQEMASLVAV